MHLKLKSSSFLQFGSHCKATARKLATVQQHSQVILHVSEYAFMFALCIPCCEEWKQHGSSVARD